MVIAPDPVSSGRPCRIVGKAAGTPHDLNHFIGEASFTIDSDGARVVVCGLRAADGAGVHFYEKDVEHSGKDVRAWLTEYPAGSFVARPTATFR